MSTRPARATLLAPLTSISVLALSLVGPTPSFAQTLPQQCGPDCSTPGRWLICNDSFDSSGAIAGWSYIRDDFDTNFGGNERACTSFTAPAANFTLVGWTAVFSSAVAAGVSYVPTVWAENGVAQSGAPLSNMFSESGQSPQPGSGGTPIMSGALLSNSLALTVDFRLCLQAQTTDPNGRNLAFDSDGVQAFNTLYFAQGGQGGPNGWYDATNGTLGGDAITGDYILRALVDYAGDMTPWQSGGVCDTGADAGVVDSGVADDSGVEVDAGFDDGGVADAAAIDAAPPADTGVVDDAGLADGGVGTDAGGQDGGGQDGGAVGDDAGETGLPPIITSMTPDEGPNTQSTDVIVSGNNFAEGVTLKIGAIPAVDVTRPGSTTIVATVPAGIAPGTYDVIAQNPDGQAAVASQAYTVTDPDGNNGAPPDDGCGCQSAEGGSTRGGFVILLGLLLLLLMRRVPGTVLRPVLRRMKSS